MKNPSKNILANACNFYQQGVCTSCELMNYSIAESLEIKTQKLSKLFPEAKILNFEALDSFLGSRQKAKLAAFSDKEAIEFGLYQFNKKINLEKCPLYSTALQKIIAKIKDFLISCHVECYNLETQSGELKFVIINEAIWHHHSTFMVRLVLRSKQAFNQLKKNTPFFLASNPEIQVLSCNFQPLHAAILEGEEETCLSPEKYFEMPLLNNTYFLGTKSFSQVNQKIANKLYEYVKNFIQENKIHSMLELYCGVGGFTFAAEDFLEKSVGIEVSAGAIQAAKITLVKRKNSKSKFYAEKAQDFLAKNKEAFDLILVNPPRNGLDLKSIEAIKQMTCQYFIYSSCHPETLKRDFQSFESHYELLSLKPFDMFPQTKHLEVVAVFKSLNSKFRA